MTAQLAAAAPGPAGLDHRKFPEHAVILGAAGAAAGGDVAAWGAAGAGVSGPVAVVDGGAW